MIEIAIADFVSLEEGNEGITEFDFEVSLNEASEETITVDFATADEIAIAGQDYIESSGTLEFEPGETSQTITVDVIADTDYELRFDESGSNDVFFTVNLSNPSNAELANSISTGIIRNDDELPENALELFRFRNNNLTTDSYVFVGEQETEEIRGDIELSSSFTLDDGVIRFFDPRGFSDFNPPPAPQFVASLTPEPDTIPIYRLRSLETDGTYLYVSTEEYNVIFAEDSDYRNIWITEGLDEANNDIPEFYLRHGGSSIGQTYNRFQSIENNTFLYADAQQTAEIETNPEIARLYINQGAAFNSFF